MNAYLKEIAGVCEIEKELTIHIAEDMKILKGKFINLNTTNSFTLKKK